MKKLILKRNSRSARRRRIRSRVFGTAQRPRLSVFRSSQHIYAQLINDEKSSSIAHVSSVTVAKTQKATKKEMAKIVGKKIAEAAKAKGVTKVSFDRGGFDYSGRVKDLAEAARSGGLEF